MSNLSDEFDFDAALKKKVEEAKAEAPSEGEGTTPAPGEAPPPEGTSPAVEPQRDERGRFARAEEEGQPQEELILGKFKTQDDLVKSYQELERHFHEQQQTPEQPVAPEQPALSDQQVTAFKQLAQDNPGQAAALAVQYNQPLLYEEAMENWYEEDPRRAVAFEMDLRQRVMMAQVAAYVQPQLQPLAQRNTEAEFAEAYRQTSARYPDIGQHQEAMYEVANTRPELLQALSQPGIEAKSRVLESLYAIAKVTAPQTQAPVVAPPQTDPRQEAFVVSSGGPAPVTEAPTGVAKLKDYLLQEDWKQGMNFK